MNDFEKLYDPYSWNLREVFSHIYQIPTFQRPYSWDKEKQVLPLLDDIFNAYHAPEPERRTGLFTGTMYVRRTGKTACNGNASIYDIIDGQQRITTFALILLAVLSLAKSRGIDENDTDFAEIRSLLWKKSDVQRKSVKENRMLELNSLEKQMFGSIMSSAFDDIVGLPAFIASYDFKSDVEKRIADNFQEIYDRINREFPGSDPNGIMLFADYLLDSTQFVVIMANCEMDKVFSMFEAINSKGKQLDATDHIKTYIFQVLHESDYDEYLDKWGKLIVSTGDQLYDYLYTFIRAYVSFYKQSINLDEFKAVVSRGLPNLFGPKPEDELLKKLIDTMLAESDCYAALSSYEKAKAIVGDNDQFKTFFLIKNIIGYEHSTPLIFRAFAERKANKITSQDVFSVVKDAVLFSFKAQSIPQGPSHSMIQPFKRVTEAFYGKDRIDAATVKSKLSEEMMAMGVTEENAKLYLEKINGYTSRGLGFVIQALFESMAQTADRKISFTQASLLLENCHGKTFDLDHLLPQDPGKDDSDFHYFCDGPMGKLHFKKGKLVLKEGNDFPAESVFENMPYGEFETNVLDKVGNLHIMFKDKNIQKSNTAITLPVYGKYTTYKQVSERTKEIAKALFECADLK
jgi:uncharacterized protein with ParB-like and HNH nuclease domain